MLQANTKYKEKVHCSLRLCLRKKTPALRGHLTNYKKTAHNQHATTEDFICARLVLRLMWQT